MVEWWEVASCKLQGAIIIYYIRPIWIFSFFFFHLNIFYELQNLFLIHSPFKYYTVYHLFHDFEFETIYLSFEYRDIPSEKAHVIHKIRDNVFRKAETAHRNGNNSLKFSFIQNETQIRSKGLPSLRAQANIHLHSIMYEISFTICDMIAIVKYRIVFLFDFRRHAFVNLVQSVYFQIKKSQIHIFEANEMFNCII